MMFVESPALAAQAAAESAGGAATAATLAGGAPAMGAVVPMGLGTFANRSGDTRGGVGRPNESCWRNIEATTGEISCTPSANTT